jgi:ABC-type nitrate/sulfonate/bicarbonate transport system substrate-binding protein
MKGRHLLFGLVGLLLGRAALADPALTVALPEGLSPRTVGFYLAAEKGYYGAAGVTVALTAPRADGHASDALVQGKADLAVELMPIALKRREAGDKLAHVAQIFRKAGMEVVSRPISRIMWSASGSAGWRARSMPGSPASRSTRSAGRAASRCCGRTTGWNPSSAISRIA